MRLFIETLMQLIEEEGMSQSDLVDLCNETGAKDGLQISKGAISNYKQGRFPEPAYAALLIRNVSREVARRNELAVAYLRDVANELGVSTAEVGVVNLRTKDMDRMQALPAALREQLADVGHASLKISEIRAMVGGLSALSKQQNEELRTGPAKPSLRGVKRRRRATKK